MERKLLTTAYTEQLQDKTIARSFFKKTLDIGISKTVEFDSRLLSNKAAQRGNSKSGYNQNTVGAYATKHYSPVVYKESLGVSADSMLVKQFGGISSILGNEQLKMLPAFMKDVVVPRTQEIANKIVTDLDLQAIEILTTGGVAARDAFAGVSYIDSSDTNHFNTVSTVWTDNAAEPIKDLTALAKLIKINGMKSISNIIMNDATFELLASNASFKAAYETRRVDLGKIQLPANTRSSANYWGDVMINAKRVKIWVESAYYENNAGVQTQFIPNNKVILIADDNEFVQWFGSIARFKTNNNNLMDFLSGDFTLENNLKISQIAVADHYGLGLDIALDCSALLVAKSKGFGCLTVG